MLLHIYGAYLSTIKHCQFFVVLDKNKLFICLVFCGTKVCENGTVSYLFILIFIFSFYMDLYFTDISNYSILQLFYSFFKSLVGKDVVVELKNDLRLVKILSVWAIIKAFSA